MSESYVPDTETVREQYTREQPPHIGTVSEKSAEFYRWLRQVKAEALREYADLVEEIANLGANNTGLRTPHHLAEYTRNYADGIESQETP